MKLYSFFRSSAAWRVRIALALKGLDYDFESVHLRKDGGGQNKPAYKAMNPQGLVPVLEADGKHLIQSMAIIEYLDEVHPEPALLHGDAAGRAHIRAIAQIIACEIHPLNNLRILQYLGGRLGHDEDVRTEWYHHWVKSGFDGIEPMIAGDQKFCCGDQPSLADICLIPQVFNAERFGFDLSPYPKIKAVNDAALALPAFSATAPGKQPDAE